MSSATTEVRPERRSKKRDRLNELENRLVAQEHRFAIILLNFFRAFFGDARGKTGRKASALAALVYSVPSRFFFRASLVGGLIAVMTLLVLRTQNSLLAGQTVYASVAAYGTEAQRSSNYVGAIEGALGAFRRDGSVDKGAIAHLVALTQVVAPYKRQVNSIHVSTPSGYHGGGILFALVDGASLAIGNVVGMPDASGLISLNAYPQLTEVPSSPERGLILRELVGYGRDPREFRAAGATFDYADVQDLVAVGADWSTNPEERRRLGFSGGNFERCDLHDSNLSGVVLIGTNLRFCDLRNVKFERSVLDRADFVYAVLDGADLRSASLAGTNMQLTTVKLAHLEGANLERAEGLETVQIEDACMDARTRLPPQLSRVGGSYRRPKGCD